MNWYKNHSKEWKEIIETVAREIGRTELMVEKDTVQSMFLFELAKAELPFVFKGGTSLSKAYNLIDRFSEDIDLSMNRKPTESERKESKELIIQIAESLGMTLANPDKIRNSSVLPSICLIPPHVPVINTMSHENNNTTTVRIAVATFESVFLIPHFARIAVIPAKNEDPIA